MSFKTNIKVIADRCRKLGMRVEDHRDGTFTLHPRDPGRPTRPRRAEGAPQQKGTPDSLSKDAE